MILTNTKRIIKTGFVNFWRNGFLSFSAIVVITLSLLAFGLMMYASAFGHAMLSDVKDKVDINIYFTLDAGESDILALKKDIEKLPEVSKVEYISRDQTLSDFKERWKDNALIMQGLEEVGSNPFPATLNVKAKEPGQYAGIAQFLTNKNPVDSNNTPIVDKINYEENKVIIDRLGRIIPAVEKVGLIVTIALILVSIIVIWNTIRLIIFTAREEISVMKLVGASNSYVRGPFVVSGIMYGFVSAIISMALLAGFAFWSDRALLKFAGVEVAKDFSIFVNVLSNYFMNNLPAMFVIIVLAGIILGGISSYVAARRYLKV
jgi:cell division transport system permease protein